MLDRMTVEHLTPLENAVIEAILLGRPQAEECLREQLQQSELNSRKFNGYGFYTHLIIPERVPSCSIRERTLHASCFLGGQPCGFILWLNDGRVECLEGYPLGGDSWPKSESFGTITLNKS